MQVPATQVWPAPQALLHPPQWAAVVCVSTQVLPQTVLGALQHTPDMHVSVPMQALSHPPQCVLFVSVSLQWGRGC